MAKTWFICEHFPDLVGFILPHQLIFPDLVDFILPHQLTFFRLGRLNFTSPTNLFQTWSTLFYLTNSPFSGLVNFILPHQLNFVLRIYILERLNICISSFQVFKILSAKFSLIFSMRAGTFGTLWRSHQRPFTPGFNAHSDSDV